MKIPKTVRIGAHDLEVIQAIMPFDHGDADTDELRLFVRTNTPQALREETFFHECLHTIRTFTGTEEKDRDIEEQIVQAQAHMLYQFLIDNDLY